MQTQAAPGRILSSAKTVLRQKRGRYNGELIHVKIDRDSTEHVFNLSVVLFLSIETHKHAPALFLE